jgi:hypothetical protein
MEALIIRTLYNNQDWRAPCKEPYGDPLCYYCLGNKLGLVIRPPSPGRSACDGECGEQDLCKLHRWGCHPSGLRWGRRAKPGMRVFFVFREVHKSKPRLYTLWGKATIKTIDPFPGTRGYYFMHFDQFRPAPRNTWRTHLTAAQIVGKPFGRGIYRYIPSPIAQQLDRMIPSS